jgi:hypothetical protein
MIEAGWDHVAYAVDAAFIVALMAFFWQEEAHRCSRQPDETSALVVFHRLLVFRVNTGTVVCASFFLFVSPAVSPGCIKWADS